MRRPLALLALLLSAALPSSAANLKLSLPTTRTAPGVGAFTVPGLSLGYTPITALTPGQSLLVTPSLTPLFTPASLTPTPSIIPQIQAEAPQAPAPAASVQAGLQNVTDALHAPNADFSSRQSALDGMYHGAPLPSVTPSGQSGSGADYIINDEGVKINDRAAKYYMEVRRMVELYKGKINLEESLDVMDDAYADVLAKVSAVEAVANGRGLQQANTHLEETLTFVDGVLEDGKKKVAVHTHRVFFHKAKEAKSEIAEGIRRVDGYIRDAEQMFRKGGKAEAQMGQLDEVELVFDARGYQEIKDHIKLRGEAVTARTKGRISFKFLDEVAPLPKEQKAIRAKLNDLAHKYNGEGLSKIYEGVIYSRYVGLLLELKTVEHYHKLGYKILQSGRELFDENGMYISELDVVVESPEGVVSVVEAKSARVGLPLDEVLEDKVAYKLRTYKKFKAQLDAMIGKPFSAVVFSMDVGIDPDMPEDQMTERDIPRMELVEFLRSNEAALSKEYGFPVSFLFIQSGPAGENARMRQGRGNSRRNSPRGDRKHGRGR